MSVSAVAAATTTTPDRDDEKSPVPNLKKSLQDYATWTVETAKASSQRIYQHIKTSCGIKTPQELLGPFQNKLLVLPIPIQKESTIKLDQLPSHLKSGDFFINGSKRALKEKDPLEEGDIVCTETEEGDLLYRFTVGTKTSVICVDPKNPRPLPPRSDEAIKQTKTYLRKQHFLQNVPVKLDFTTHPRGAEFTEPFLNGFIFSPYLYTWEDLERLEVGFVKSLKSGEQILVDLTHDKLLKSLIDYFKQEFQTLNYTDTEKAIRLYQFIFSSLVCKKLPETLKDSSYYLGEFLRSGGECRHFALLFKIMADQFGLSNVMVLARIEDPLEPHPWNIALVDDKRYLVDIFYGRFFLMDNPPDTSWIAYYGIKALRSSA